MSLYSVKMLGFIVKSNTDYMKCSKSFLLFLVVLVLVCALFVSLWPRGRPLSSPKDYANSKTSTIINTIQLGLDVYSLYYGHLPSGADMVNGQQVNRLLVAILSAETNNPVVHEANPDLESMIDASISQNNSDLLDFWGHPLHIVFATNHSDSVVIGGVIVTNKYAIWSDGANQRNEFGTGDDLCSWKEKGRVRKR
jgi:hypothetical protein